MVFLFVQVVSDIGLNKVVAILLLNKIGGA
jgi:hypothetical protein